MHVHETILQRLGRAFNKRSDDVTQEPLPKRWTDLIQHLNEQERKQSKRPEPDIKRRPGALEK